MSKSNEADLQRKESIEKLVNERSDLFEELKALEQSHDIEADELESKIDIITDQISTLQALTSGIT